MERSDATGRWQPQPKMACGRTLRGIAWRVSFLPFPHFAVVDHDFIRVASVRNAPRLALSGVGTRGRTTSEGPVALQARRVVDPQLPEVKAAPVQIQQVLLNLIINALDAVEGLSPAERRIIISTCSDKGDVAEVTVRDFGTGLPKDRPTKSSITSFQPNRRNGNG